MKYSWLVVALSLGHFLAQSFAQTRDRPVKAVPLATVKNDFVELNLITHEDAMDFQHCKVAIKITCLSDKSLVLPTSGVPFHSTIILTDGNGGSCPRTHLGEQFSPEGSRIGSEQLALLRKGESKTYLLNLEDFFVLKAGEWRLSYQTSIRFEDPILSESGEAFLSINDKAITLTSSQKK